MSRGRRLTVILASVLLLAGLAATIVAGTLAARDSGAASSPSASATPDALPPAPYTIDFPATPALENTVSSSNGVDLPVETRSVIDGAKAWIVTTTSFPPGSLTQDRDTLLSGALKAASTGTKTTVEGAGFIELDGERAISGTLVDAQGTESGVVLVVHGDDLISILCANPDPAIRSQFFSSFAFAK